MLKFTNQGQENEAFEGDQPQPLKVEQQQQRPPVKSNNAEEEAEVIRRLEDTINMGASISKDPDEKSVLKSFAAGLSYNTPKEEFPDKAAFAKDDGNNDDDDDGEGQERQQWTNPVEFLLSCIAMSVGLGMQIDQF